MTHYTESFSDSVQWHLNLVALSYGLGATEQPVVYSHGDLLVRLPTQCSHLPDPPAAELDSFTHRLKAGTATGGLSEVPVNPYYTWNITLFVCTFELRHDAFCA